MPRARLNRHAPPLWSEICVPCVVILPCAHCGSYSFDSILWKPVLKKRSLLTVVNLVQRMPTCLPSWPLHRHIIEHCPHGPPPMTCSPSLGCFEPGRCETVQGLGWLAKCRTPSPRRNHFNGMNLLLGPLSLGHSLHSAATLLSVECK